MSHSGSCLCGQTTVTLASKHGGQIICHCTNCKKTSGSEFATCVLELQKNVKIEGPVKTFVSSAESGNTVTHIFCSNCGSQISHKSPGFGESQVVRTGLFSDFTGVPIVAELFVKSRWNVVPAVNGAAQMEAMPPA
ncbi:Mss4-like protein [Mycena epipterygia]|nr:Mss4-like protein [Mycena epipterygia]